MNEGSPKVRKTGSPKVKKNPGSEVGSPKSKDEVRGERVKAKGTPKQEQDDSEAGIPIAMGATSAIKEHSAIGIPQSELEQHSEIKRSKTAPSKGKSFGYGCWIRPRNTFGVRIAVMLNVIQHLSLFRP